MSATAQAGFAFAAGIAAFFSPCVVALLPGYVSYYVATVEGETAPLAGALARGGAASLGAIGTFAVLSILAFVAREAVKSAVPVLEYLVGVLLVVSGVLILRKSALSFTVPLPQRRASVLGFGGFGAMYALAATACVLPLFVSITGVSFTLSPPGTLLVLGSYAAGFTVLVLAATVTTAIGRQALLERAVTRTGTLTKVAGVTLILAGVVQLLVAYRLDALESLPFFLEYVSYEETVGRFRP